MDVVGRGHVSTEAITWCGAGCGADVNINSRTSHARNSGKGRRGRGAGGSRAAYCSYCRGRSGHGHTLCTIVARVHGGWVGGGRLGKRLFSDSGMANSDPEYARPKAKSHLAIFWVGI